MIESAESAMQGQELTADVCVVGASRVGISLALASSGLQVLLLEGGQRKPDANSQDLYEGEVADEALHCPPVRYRMRQFGGTTTTSHRFFKRTIAPRKILSVILKNPNNRFSLEVNAEQPPLKHSRVMLTDQRDALAARRLRVDWHFADSDIASVAISLKAMAEDFATTGTGQLSFDPVSPRDHVARGRACGGHQRGGCRCLRAWRGQLVRGGQRDVRKFGAGQPHAHGRGAAAGRSLGFQAQRAGVRRQCCGVVRWPCVS